MRCGLFAIGAFRPCSAEIATHSILLFIQSNMEVTDFQYFAFPANKWHAVCIAEQRLQMQTRLPYVCRTENNI